MTPLRVLVVDDSPLTIEAVVAILEADGDIQVVGVAKNGLEAVAETQRIRPDLVAMDIQMPVMNGLEAVERIMASVPTPILLLTGDPSRQGERGSFEALSRGALDLVAKPAVMAGSGEQQARFRDHVRLLAKVSVVYRRRKRASGPPAMRPVRSGGCVGIVGSTGGPPVIAEILAGLPADLPLPVVVVQHLAPGFAAHLTSWLADSSPLPVKQAQHRAMLQPGVVYVAPDGAHVTVDRRRRLLLDGESPPDRGHRPSGTRLLRSLAQAFAELAVGVVVTGMGKDGADGMVAIRRAGGMTITQDEATSVVYGMPRAARELGAAEWVRPRDQLAHAICRAAERIVLRAG